MFRLLKFTCALGMLFFAGLATAAEEGGRVVLDLQEDPAPPATIGDYQDLWRGYMREIDEFDKAMPGQNIEEDFFDDVALRHPEEGDNTVQLRESAIRYGVRLKRFYQAVRDKFQDFILKNDIPIRLDDEEYADSKPEIYHPSENGEPLIITDFKKIVSYADSERDRLAAAEKSAADAGLPSPAQKREELKRAFLRGDWKSVFSYGLFDGKPLEDNRGIGEWSDGGFVRARLLLSGKTVGDGAPLKGALHVAVEPGKLLLSRPLKKYAGTSVRFAPWASLRQIIPHWPLPQRRILPDGSELTGYVGNIFIPLEIEINNPFGDLVLNAEVRAVVCGEENCAEVLLQPQVSIHPGKFEESDAAAFLRQKWLEIPVRESDKLKLMRVVAETSPDPSQPQVIRVELEADDNPAGTEVFIEGEEETAFAPPLMTIDGNTVSARFRALESGRNFTGKNLTIAAHMAPTVSIRTVAKVENASLFDLQSRRLTWGMVGIALLGGFLLNLMPCVFPVLSLKILSFLEFGALNTTRIRRGFLFNLLGITVSFTLIIFGLLIMKAAGHSLGWGMQFQSIGFLIFVIFVIVLFLAQVHGLINLKSPQFVETILQKPEKDSRLLHFLTGVFLVLLSTPCTAPYLGTALGFALSGTPCDIIIIVAAVGLGLSLPYIVFAVFPGLVYFVPRPGPWMRRLERLMSFLLLVTLGWLLMILAAQTGNGVLGWLIVCIVCFWGVLWMRKILFEAADGRKDLDDVRKKLKIILNLISGMFLALIIAAACWRAFTVSENRKSEQNAARTEQLIAPENIKRLVDAGNIVLVKIGADWCLTCGYNDVSVFNTVAAQDMFERYGVVVIEVDWTGYNRVVLEFMEKYGRRGLPFYIVFSPKIPQGLVLPEIMSDESFKRILENISY